MSKQTVDVAKTVALINQAIVLSDKKRKVLIELREAIIREHAEPNASFPRPMGVPRMTHALNADCPDVQAGRWTRCRGHDA